MTQVAVVAQVQSLALELPHVSPSSNTAICVLDQSSSGLRESLKKEEMAQVKCQLGHFP